MIFRQTVHPGAGDALGSLLGMPARVNRCGCESQRKTGEKLLAANVARCCGGNTAKGGVIMGRVRDNCKRQWRKTSCLIAAVASVFVIACAAQTAVTDPYAAARANADRQAKEWIARGIPGLSLTVAVDG